MNTSDITKTMNKNIKPLHHLTPKIPVHFGIGISLVTIVWILNWSLSGLRSHFLFFPLWMGYALTIDGIVWMRKGNSLFSRNKIKFILLFIFSIPCWWLFELINLRTQNWVYLGKEQFTLLQFYLFSSLNFSTVIPAVFSSAELISTFSPIKKMKKWITISINNKSITFFLLIGIFLFLLILLFPKFFYPFVWLSIYLIIDPINYWLGNPTLLKELHKGDWKKVIALACGALTCGFFWEMWNYLSYPKWIYNTSFVEFCYFFEMPMLGYLGYIPFSFEIFALYNLITKSFKKKKTERYIDIC